MKNDINLSSIKEKVAVVISLLIKHISFVAIIFILSIFLISVYRISQLATADPTPDQQSTAEITSVPKVDQKAINQVLQLENSSPQVHALFNDARNNPFGE